MAKFVMKFNGKEFEGFLNDDEVGIKYPKLDLIIEAFEKANIEKISLKDNQLQLLMSGNYIIIDDFDKFEKLDKYASFKEKYKKLIAKMNSETINKVKSNPNKKKVNRKSSVSTKVKTAVLIIALLGTGAITLNRYLDSVNKDNIVPQPSNSEAGIIIVGLPEDEQSNFIVVDPKTIFDEEVNKYATEKGIDPLSLSTLLYNNTIYENYRLNHFKILINYMAYFRNNSYNVEIINSNQGQSGIFAYNYNKFAIIPENIEEVNSIVQLNPSNIPSYYCYEEILNDIKSGNIPSSILVGTSNEEVDFDNYANGNILENVIEFSLNQGIAIQNVGVLGYNGSGSSALINAGKILKDYPNMHLRVSTLDGYNDQYISALNGVIREEQQKYSAEIKALLRSNAELTFIIPTSGGYGITNGRPKDALDECMLIATYHKNVNIIAANTTNYKDFITVAYRSHIINYLAGEINWEDLVDGTTYYIPSANINTVPDTYAYNNVTPAYSAPAAPAEEPTVEAPVQEEPVQEESDDIVNDVIYFG